MNTRISLPSSAAGLNLRATAILVLLLGFAANVCAAPITQISIPGSYSLTAAQWTNSNGATAFGNLNDGTPFYATASGVTNLGFNAADWMTLAPVGQWSDGTSTYTLGSGLFSDFQEYGVIWKDGFILSTHANFLFQGADQDGNFAASTGAATWGTIAGFLANGTYNSRPNQPGEFGSDGGAVSGGVVAGTIARLDTSLRALCGGVAMGTNASASAVDAMSGNCLGTEGGYATIFNPATGTTSRLPSSTGSGFQQGRITSGFGGFYTIDHNGVPFYSDGNQTWDQGTYFILKSLAGDPAWSRFIGDKNTGSVALIGQNSIDFNLANNVDVFKGTTTPEGAVPEPGTYLLLVIGGFSLWYCKRRGWISAV